MILPLLLLFSATEQGILLDGNVLVREPREFSILVIRDTGRVGISSEGIASLRDMPSVQYAANIVIRQIGRRRGKGKEGGEKRERTGKSRDENKRAPELVVPRNIGKRVEPQKNYIELRQAEERN